ncbi:brain-specific angiogenesis inhibitor 1-associated protein 2 [Trichonephila clavipes]|nr:brain-specific angiogenesis inhibitor 1-associated protein 2 [Trichonephila clavipes]
MKAIEEFLENRFREVLMEKLLHINYGNEFTLHMLLIFQYAIRDENTDGKDSQRRTLNENMTGRVIVCRSGHYNVSEYRLSAIPADCSQAPRKYGRERRVLKCGPRQREVLKAFYVDLLLPLESNLEKDTKVVAGEHKRFLQQHKSHHDSYQKALSMCKKQKKRTRCSLLTIGKDVKQLHAMEDEKKKLDGFCDQSLKQNILKNNLTCRACFCLLPPIGALKTGSPHVLSRRVYPERRGTGF